MSVKNFIWDVVSDNVLMEIDDEGNTLARYVQEPDLYGEVISQERDGETRYYNYDGLGNTVELTDENENVTDTYEYSAFGEEIARTGTTENPFGYKGAVGYYTNTETSDIYVRARTYEPKIGRWLSQDPLRFDANNLNLYEYVDGRPLNVVDPDGRAPIVVGTPKCVGKVKPLVQAVCNVAPTCIATDPWGTKYLKHCMDRLCRGSWTLTVKCPEELGRLASWWCEGACGFSWPHGRTLYVCPQTSGCPDLRCTIVHELTHMCGDPTEAGPLGCEEACFPNLGCTKNGDPDTIVLVIRRSIQLHAIGRRRGVPTDPNQVCQVQEKLTLVDLFVLIFTCSLAAFFLRSLNLTYSEGLDVGYAAIVLLAGPALAGPVVLAIGFVRGRREMLLPGEVAWCGTAVALTLCIAGLWTKPHTPAWLLYSAWLFVLWPLSATLLLCYSTVQHARLRCGKRWSHVVGIGLSLTQLVLVVTLALTM